MKGYIYLLVSLIIIVVICVLSRKEGFTDFPNLKTRSGGFERPMEDYTLLEPYNYLQTEFIKLQNVLNSISNKKEQRLTNVKNHYKYIPATTDPEIIREMDRITNLILSRLNQLYSEYNYQSKFKKTDYDHVEVFSDHANNLNIIYDVFIQEHQRFPYGVRLRIDAIVFNENLDKMVSNNRIVKNMKNADADFRLPSRSLNNDILDINGKEIMPGPLNVLSTPHWPILDTINWRSPRPTNVRSNIYINNIRAYNSELIINPDKGTRKIDGGINNSTLEYKCYSNARNYRMEPNVIRNKWIPLETEPKCLKQWPCVPVSKCWDSLGVKKPLGKETPLCNGLRSSTTQAPLRAEFNPSIHTNPRSQGLYSWLFHLYTQQGSSRIFN